MMFKDFLAINKRSGCRVNGPHLLAIATNMKRIENLYQDPKQDASIGETEDNNSATKNFICTATNSSAWHPISQR